MRWHRRRWISQKREPQPGGSYSTWHGSPDAARRLEAARQLTGKATGSAERDQLAVCLRVLSSLVRDLGLLSTRSDPRLLANADLEADLGPLTNSFDSARSQRAFTAVDQALGALDRNVNPKVVADWLVLQL